MACGSILHCTCILPCATNACERDDFGSGGGGGGLHNQGKHQMSGLPLSLIKLSGWVDDTSTMDETLEMSLWVVTGE